MFDPANEPQDIFAETEPAKPAPGTMPGARPRPVSASPGIEAEARSGSAVASGPSKLIFAVIALVVLGGIGVGAWFWFFRSAPAPEPVADTTTAPAAPVVDVVPTAPEPTPEPTPQAPEETPTAAEPALPPDEAAGPVDTDGDGLSDSQEAMFGTDPQRADTDDDGLSDREEMSIYETNPKDPDSDGDGYLDGEEVRNGYDPAGPGRLFTVPPTSP